MTPQEFMKECEHDGSYIPVSEVIRLMIEYSKVMCDRQKEICAKNIHFEFGEFDLEGISIKQIVDIDYEKLFNSPYPKELL